jgi:chorismate mutase
MFAFGLITKKKSQVQSAEAEQAAPVHQQAGLNLAQPQVQPTASDTAAEDKTKIAMTEKQLRELIYEVRDKIKEYDSKSQELTTREQKLQTAQETLKNDIAELDNLRIELASTVASIKSEQDKLLKSQIAVANTEKANLVSIAATYDKMDSSQAGKILSNMSQAKSGNGDDAVKILYYMADRTKAKVLASIAETEPAISADFCQKLKQITEKD